MATNPEEQIQATPTPVVATQPVVQPQTILSSPTAAAVYDPINVQQVSVPGEKKAMDMKLSKLENKLSKASSTAELNQINIMNQTKAMGVLTGEAAHQSRLDTAKLNAFNSLYQNRLAKEQRKEQERQLFMSQYGADPSDRPKGMSKREFIKQLTAKGGTPLQLQQESASLDLALKRKQLAGGSGSSVPAGASPELAALSSIYNQTGGDWGATANALASQGYDVSTGSVIDNELRRRNGLAPIVSKTAAQQQSELEAQQQQQILASDMQDKIAKIDALSSDKYLSGAVGPNYFSRLSPTSRITGGKQNFIAGVENITSKETMDVLLTLKQAGGTLGALSDQERIMLQQAASKIGNWRILNKNGQVVGYNTSEATFKAELNRLKELAQKALARAGGSDNDPLGLGL